MSSASDELLIADTILPGDTEEPILLLQRKMQDAVTHEQRINLCKAAISRMYEMLRENPGSWRSFLSLARSVIAHLDSTSYMQEDDATWEQTWIINGIQRMAFVDADNGAITELDAWAARHWLALLERDDQNVVVLRGVGWAWLQRAQPALARIHRHDGTSSSSGGSARSQVLPGMVFNAVDDARLAVHANAEAERRSGTADYVEARGFLHPSTEYMTRAVVAAASQGISSGELLSTAAEAFMSLGNASSPRVNERHFQRAVRLLRAASNVDGYSLPNHLQHYLDDFGRFVG